MVRNGRLRNTRTNSQNLRSSRAAQTPEQQAQRREVFEK